MRFVAREIRNMRHKGRFDARMSHNEGCEVQIRRTTRRKRRIHDELPLVAEKCKEFRATGEVTL